MEFMGKNRMNNFVSGNLSMTLGGFASGIKGRLDIYSKTDVMSRIYRKDPTVWIHDRERATAAPELLDRLGWLNTPNEMKGEVQGIMSFAAEIRAQGFRDVVLLGMGGSSLAPEVFSKTFGQAKGFPKLTVLDTTVPEDIVVLSKELDHSRTLFLVSSKSGGTLETLSLFKYFWGLVKEKKGDPGKNFAALTDKGSSLERIAVENGFRKIFTTPKDVGGRYSALTYFGLVPAALIGVDIEKILDRASDMLLKSHKKYPLEDNPSAVLGCALGELALTGRNKLVIFAGGSVKSFGAWAEQLIAESTGKAGKGILPVVDEIGGIPSTFGRDSVFVSIALKDEKDEDLEGEIEALIRCENPVIRIALIDKYDIGGEFYRWEAATALAGAILGINPFDQPDVESTKKKTKEAMDAPARGDDFYGSDPVYRDEGIEVFASLDVRGDDLAVLLDNFLEIKRKDGYLALMAYLPKSEKVLKFLDDIRKGLHRRTACAVTLGMGPRFLHSTGQLHKGDDNSGLFLQLIYEPARKLEVYGGGYTFGTMLKAQAAGDFKALSEKGRKVVSIRIKGDYEEQLARIAAVFK